MKTMSMLLVAFFGLSFSQVAMAQNRAATVLDRNNSPFPPLAAKSLDEGALGEMLAALGYRAERIEVQGSVVYKVPLRHRSGERVHMVAVDKASKTIVVVGGGFDFMPNSTLAGNAFFQKLLKINNAISPNQIFLNDSGVFGLTSVLGNSDVTPEQLRNLLNAHVERFDTQLEPLVRQIATR